MKIAWTRYKSYDGAKDCTGVVYLHEWNGSPFYWGIADTTVFGGNPRQVEGERRNPRYGRSYRHWIEGVLRHGGRLYVGRVDDLGTYSLKDVEAYLLKRYGSEVNDPIDDATEITEQVEHEGNVPETIHRPAL